MARIRRRVETRLCHLHVSVVKTAVAFHKRLLGIIKSDGGNVRESVVDELGAIGLLKLDGFLPTDNIVVAEYVVLRSPRVCRFRSVGPFVRVDVVPIFANQVGGGIVGVLRRTYHEPKTACVKRRAGGPTQSVWRISAVQLTACSNSVHSFGGRLGYLPARELKVQNKGVPRHGVSTPLCIFRYLRCITSNRIPNWSNRGYTNRGKRQTNYSRTIDPFKPWSATIRIVEGRGADTNPCREPLNTSITDCWAEKVV